jgi:uncharacterized protein (TIGR02421 family)
MKKKEYKAEDQAFETLIHTICERLSEGKQVRRTLPYDGRLHIDRTLPFLMVYRRPQKRSDKGTDLLLKGEASYMIASGSRRFKPGLTKLVSAVGETLADKCGALLIIEIWSGEEDPDMEMATAMPAFRIFLPSAGPLTGTAEPLEKALRKIKLNKRSADVEIVYRKQGSPPGPGLLIPKKEADRLNCFLMGLEIRPVYRSPNNGEVYPLKLRKLHVGLSRALKRAAFEFSHSQTNLRPGHYYSLGRRAMVKAVWDVDRRLADISNAYDFLLLLTPVNFDAAWSQFKKHQYKQAPVFYYRPRNIDPAAVKREIYKIPVETVEDPVLASLFREKRTELDRQVTMIENRETKNFLYSSLQLFGGISDNLIGLAEEILEVLPPHSHDDSRKKSINAAALANRVKHELQYYRQIDPSMTAGVHIRSDIVGLMVSRGNLLINRNLKIPVSRVEALIQHEVGTHIITYFNGRVQPFRQLYSGLAGYEELQEGMAVLAEYLAGGFSRPRLRLLAGRVAAVKCLTEGASFIETFRKLNAGYGFEQRAAFTMTARVYRSGGLTKDAVYLRGLVKLLKYLEQGGEIAPLFVGKISTDHVPIIQELQWRKVLHGVPMSPRYLDFPETAEKLKKLRHGYSVLDLIERRKK